MRCYAFVVSLACFISCNSLELGDQFKSENGLFKVHMVSPIGSSSWPASSIETDKVIPFNWTVFGKKSDSDFPLNSVFVLGNISGQEEIEILPVGVINLKSETSQRDVVIAFPANPAFTEKETTTFFYLQMYFHDEMTEMRSWIENGSDLNWISVGWQDEVNARSRLNRIMKGI